MKLNLGCGPDYKEGFINIDASTVFEADKKIDLAKESLTEHFAKDSVEFIMAYDVIEHLYHWEALSLLKDICSILKPYGVLEARIPDCEWVINSNWTIEQKLLYLYGGQDAYEGRSDMSESRKKHPEYFCHKYGWTATRINKDWSKIFPRIHITYQNQDFIVRASKRNK